VERASPLDLTVSQNWLNKYKTDEFSLTSVYKYATGTKRDESCIVAVICRPMGTVRGPKFLRMRLEKVVTDVNGWGVETQIADGGQNYKLGYLAHAVNAPIRSSKTNPVPIACLSGKCGQTKTEQFPCVEQNPQE
jgi:hypothetical protein